MTRDPIQHCHECDLIRPTRPINDQRLCAVCNPHTQTVATDGGHEEGDT